MIRPSHPVMAGLDPAIHAPVPQPLRLDVDARIRSGHDDIAEAIALSRTSNKGMSRNIVA